MREPLFLFSLLAAVSIDKGKNIMKKKMLFLILYFKRSFNL